MKKLFFLIIFSIFILLSLKLPAQAEEQLSTVDVKPPTVDVKVPTIGEKVPTIGEKIPTVEELFKKMGEVNPGLKDYSSDIKVELQFTIRTLNFAGKYYYKKPDKYKLELKKSPSFLKKYPQIFGWSLPNLSKYNSTIKPDKDTQGQESYEVELIPIQGMGDIVKQEIWINKKDYTFPKQLFVYNYGTITVNAKYRKEGKFIVFDTLCADFDIKVPIIGSLKATANASYKNYKTNINLPDSFFVIPKKK
jgi:hypothetical protein